MERSLKLTAVEATRGNFWMHLTYWVLIVVCECVCVCVCVFIYVVCVCVCVEWTAAEPHSIIPSQPLTSSETVPSPVAAIYCHLSTQTHKALHTQCTHPHAVTANTHLMFRHTTIHLVRSTHTVSADTLHTQPGPAHTHTHSHTHTETHTHTFLQSSKLTASSVF